MPDKARMFRRVSSTLPEVEADVGVSFPSHRGASCDHATIEMTVTLIKDDRIRVRFCVRNSNSHAVWIKDKEFIADGLAVNERRKP